MRNKVSLLLIILFSFLILLPSLKAGVCSNLLYNVIQTGKNRWNAAKLGALYLNKKIHILRYYQEAQNLIISFGSASERASIANELYVRMSLLSDSKFFITKDPEKILLKQIDWKEVVPLHLFNKYSWNDISQKEQEIFINKLLNIEGISVSYFFSILNEMKRIPFSLNKDERKFPSRTRLMTSSILLNMEGFNHPDSFPDQNFEEDFVMLLNSMLTIAQTPLITDKKFSNFIFVSIVLVFPKLKTLKERVEFLFLLKEIEKRKGGENYKTLFEKFEKMNKKGFDWDAILNPGLFINIEDSYLSEDIILKSLFGFSLEKIGLSRTLDLFDYAFNKQNLK